MTLALNFPRVACFAAALIFAIYLFHPAQLLAQEEPDYPVDPALMQGMKWRNIGPYRGGRAVAVAGETGRACRGCRSPNSTRPVAPARWRRDPTQPEEDGNGTRR